MHSDSMQLHPVVFTVLCIQTGGGQIRGIDSVMSILILAYYILVNNLLKTRAKEYSSSYLILGKTLNVILEVGVRRSG